MNYIVLSRTAWEDYEYKRMLELLPERGEVCFTGAMTPVQQRSSQVRSVTLPELYKLNLQEYTLLVSSPYWLPDVLALQPAYTVALLESCPAGEDAALWDKYSASLGALADLAGTSSERIYLEQNLRRGQIVYLNGDEPVSYGLLRRGERLYFLSDAEAIWNRALTKLWQSPDSVDDGESYLDIQRRLRTRFYLSMCAKLPGEPSVYYLAASYLYLQGDETAAQLLAQSFELMLLHGYTECLHSHYRFFSAMEAKKGNLALALRQYEITAFTEEERARVTQMKLWLHGGEVQQGLLCAELMTVNEDYAAAIELLGQLPGPEAKQRLLHNYTATFQWEKALQLHQELAGKAGDTGSSSAAESTEGKVGNMQGASPGRETSSADELAERIAGQMSVIEGTLHLLYGRRHEAIRSFLRCAGADQGARQLFAEMADLEEAVQKLRGGAAGG
ncbi:hypothetical protein MKX42_06720 [Paenibacillus sp. FSL R7-0204]|uniref:hypothetical protein n=1 Tax=Paenibacillus sp. FSL R7-0204 TaxID=2921675 RepID=UPI0030FCC70D